MSTSAQPRANRENAQYSTGPKTVEDKAESSCNGLQFGLTGDSLLCHSGDEPQFAMFMRYQTSHECSFQRYLNELLSHRNQREKWRIGFELPKHCRARDIRLIEFARLFFEVHES